MHTIDTKYLLVYKATIIFAYNNTLNVTNCVKVNCLNNSSGTGHLTNGMHTKLGGPNIYREKQSSTMSETMFKEDMSQQCQYLHGGVLNKIINKQIDENITIQ